MSARIYPLPNQQERRKVDSTLGKWFLDRNMFKIALKMNHAHEKTIEILVKNLNNAKRTIIIRPPTRNTYA